MKKTRETGVGDTISPSGDIDTALKPACGKQGVIAMDSYTDNMPYRDFMNPDKNPLIIGSKLPCDVPLEYQTDIEIIYGDLTDKAKNPLTASCCGPDCERRMFIEDLRQLGADQDEIDNALSGWTPEPGCHECSV